MKSISFTFPVVSFRNIETPFTKKGFKDYYCVVNVKHLPDLENWRKINVRDPKLTGSVPRAIRGSFTENMELFMFMNRGVVLSVKNVHFDNKTSQLTIDFLDPKVHGLLDGGHTYTIIQEESKALDGDQYVKLELLEGFGNDDITQLVDARNTSNQVKDESLMNLAGTFDELKKVLKNTPYIDKIAFKEFETDESGNPKPIDIREIIAILTAFDKDNFDDVTHPINSYRSKNACLKHFKDHLKSFKKIYPLAEEILALYDTIQDRFPQLYNKARGQNGEVSGGKFGKLTGVGYSPDREISELLFIGKSSKYVVPSGFVYPILGAFRALLEEKNGRFYWAKNLNPLKMLDGNLGLKLADRMGNFALEAQNPSKTGKSISVWQGCYQVVEVEYLKSKAN